MTAQTTQSRKASRTVALIAVIAVAVTLISVLISRLLLDVIAGLIMRSTGTHLSETAATAITIPMVIFFSLGFFAALTALILDIVLIVQGPNRVRVYAGISMLMILVHAILFAATHASSGEAARSIAREPAYTIGYLAAAGALLLGPLLIALLLNRAAWKFSTTYSVTAV